MTGRGRAIAMFLVLVVSTGVVAACTTDDGSSMGHGADTSDHGMASGGTGDRMEESLPEIPGAPSVDLTADALSFAPKAITLRAGEGVNIALTSVDLEHDLFVEGIGHVAHADRGATTVAGLMIDEAGTYPMWCTVTGHRAGGMEGTITVTD